MIRAVVLFVAAMVVACHAQEKTQVFLLMGQSNMLGEGKIGPDNVNGSLGQVTHFLARASIDLSCTQFCVHLLLCVL